MELNGIAAVSHRTSLISCQVAIRLLVTSQKSPWDTLVACALLQTVVTVIVRIQLGKGNADDARSSRFCEPGPCRG